MSAKKAVTLRLEPDDYDQLEAEAKRLGMRPGTLARVYVRAGLHQHNGAETEAERRRRVGKAALRRLAVLTADLPPVDAVQVARESRDELERRSYF
jgi:hypothetical protein